MTSVLNTQLQFSLDNFYYTLEQGVIYSADTSDSIILRGTGVALDDQQHENNQNNNYLSYRVKRVLLRGVYWFYPTNRLNEEKWLTVVLYKVPAKYETGIVQPAATTHDFLTLKEYVLYSDPQSVLSWRVYSVKKFAENRYAADISLSCYKEFVLGPNDLLCCNLLFSTRGQRSVVEQPSVTAKIYYDLN